MNKSTMMGLVVVAVASAVWPLGAVSAAPRFVWLECEKPTAADFKYTVQDDERFSAGKRLHVSLKKNEVARGVPTNGLNLKYNLTAPADGTYELWLRVGFEIIRAPIDWRIDGGAWQTLAPSVPEVSLTEVWTWNGIGWCRPGRVKLTAGKHTLEFRVTKAGSDGRLLLALDCAALVAGRWNPELSLKPGQTYDQPVDRQAAAKVYQFFGAPPDALTGRPELDLTGLWQVARYDDDAMDTDTFKPVAKLPSPKDYTLRWMGIDVPGDGKDKRPELKFANRLLYRTRVKVPAAYRGRGFLVHFGGFSYIASVFVNGTYCGGRKSVLVPWDCDISRAVRPGQVNEIVVAIKTFRYAFDPTSRGIPSIQAMSHYPKAVFRNIAFTDAIFPSTKGEGPGDAIGLVFPVSFRVVGPQYTSDAYVRTSVAGKRITVDVEVTNPSGAARTLDVTCEAIDDKTGKVAKVVGTKRITVRPGQTGTTQLAATWTDPKLWWPERNANVYRMRTTLRDGGKTVDIREDTFGFRELTYEGKHTLLNGIRWHFWNWVDVGPVETDQEWLAAYEAGNDRFHRISHDHSRRFGHREKALEFLDRQGIPGRLSTCIDGMFITHNLANPITWQNFRDHVTQVVKAYRNHPSVMQWSLGNEMVLITGRLRFRKIYETVEKESAKLGAIAARLDPTRLSYQDGGGDLGGLIPANCQHYTWVRGSGFPERAYAYQVGKPVQPRGSGSFQDIYQWNGATPLVLGEVFYHAGDVGKVAWIGGPEVYRGKPQADKAAARYVRIAIEGARWQGATAICPWVRGLPDAAKSFAERAVFIKEHNTGFYGGTKLKRTIGVFNDGRRTEPLTVKWTLGAYSLWFGSGSKTYTVPPGRHIEDTITIDLPATAARKDCTLWLTLSAGGKVIFSDARPITVWPKAPAPKSVSVLAVHDPKGSVGRWLTVRNVAYRKLTSLRTVPDGTKVLLIGTDALTEANKRADAAVLKQFVAAGNTAIVLDQTYPLVGRELPVADIKLSRAKDRKASWEEFKAAGGGGSSIAHAVARAHPVLAGMRSEDFFTWAGGGLIYRFPHETPAMGTIPIIQAGPQLAQAPVIEVPVGTGSYLLCQMTLSAKLGVEPAANWLLHNILAWAGGRAAAKPGKTAVYSAGDRAFGAYLDGLGLTYDRAASVKDALAAGVSVAVVRGRKQTVDRLAADREAVRAFCRKGGWLMIDNLDTAALDSFNRLVGFTHRIRRGQTERITLANHDDPLLMGISDRDVAQYGTKMIASWMKLYRVSDKVFFSVVDGADVASFGKCRYPKISNGLTNDDFWHYIQYISGDGETVDITYDRAETFTRFSIWPNPSYYFMKDVELVFDGKTGEAMKLRLKPEKGPQTFAIDPPRKASKVSIVARTHWPRPSCRKNLMGIDNIELCRKLPAGAGAVVPLSRPGGLMKYPIGKGGIVLNQVDYTERYVRPTDRRKQRDAQNIADNVRKKRSITSSLLRNMGAAFAPVGSDLD